MNKSWLVLGLLLWPVVGYSQNATTQNGTVVPGNVTQWARDRTLQDPGGLTGRTATGVGLNPFSVTDNNGLAVCANSAPTIGTFHALCIGHDAGGNPVFNVDGINFAFTVGDGTVHGPVATVVGNPALWANAGGTLLTDPVGAVTWPLTVNLNPTASTLNKGINVGQTPSTSTVGIDTFLNQISISNDRAAAGAQNLWGFGVLWTCCTTTASGQRFGIGSRMEITGKSNTSDPLPSYVAVFGNSRVRGIAAPNAGAGVFSGNFNTSFDAGSTGYAEAQGVEIDMTMLAGSSAIRKSGLSIVQGPGDAVRGSVIDSAITLYNNPSTSGWTNAILIDNATAPVLSTAGSVIRIRATASFSEVLAIEPGVTLLHGLDFNSATITGNVLIGPGGNSQINKDGIGFFSGLRAGVGSLTIPTGAGASGLFRSGTNANLQIGPKANLASGVTLVGFSDDGSTAQGLELVAGPMRLSSSTSLALNATSLSINALPGVTCTALGAGSKTTLGIVTTC